MIREEFLGCEIADVNDVEHLGHAPHQGAQAILVLQAVCAGLLVQPNYVRTKNMMNVWIHPSSILFNPNNEYQPKTIIYHENVTTNKNYVSAVSLKKHQAFLHHRGGH